MTQQEIEKQADEVAMKYLKYCHYSTDRTSTTKEEALKLRRDYSVEAAIQDRQSVISFAKNIKLKLFNVCTVNENGISISIEEEIRILTKQIEYLKTKI